MVLAYTSEIPNFYFSAEIQYIAMTWTFHTFGYKGKRNDGSNGTLSTLLLQLDMRKSVLRQIA